MAMTDLQELREQFKALPKFDRDAILSEIMEEEAPSRKRKEDFSREEIAVHEALKRQFSTTWPIARFVERYGPTKYAERVASLFAFIQPTREHHNWKQTQELVHKLIGYLTEDLETDPDTRIMNAPWVLSNVYRLYQTVDRRFPGYADAGFLHKII